MNTYNHLQPDTIEIGGNSANIKSHLKIGNMIFYNTKRFNWLECKMWKLFFWI